MNTLGLSQRLAVVAVFLDDPSRGYTARDLSDSIGIPMMTISHILREMTKEGLLVFGRVKSPRRSRQWCKQYWMPPKVEAKIREAHEKETR